MNARRKRRLRLLRYIHEAQDNRPLLAFCSRCGKPFSPELIVFKRAGKVRWKKYCNSCKYLNLMAALGLSDLVGTSPKSPGL